MKASDLRLVNLVNYRIVDELDERKEWLEVSTIDYDDLRILEIENENNQDYQPIKLTEEWLLKFGFNKLENDIPTYYKFFGDLILDNYEFSFNIYVDWRLNYFITVFGRKITIKYVHQLQNLYSALTDEELIFRAI